MIRTLAALAVAATLLLRAPAAHAQFMPEAGPGQEQQEFGTTILLGPEGTLLGAFLVGGSVFLVERQCCTKKGDQPAIVGVAIGAAVGATIGASWTQWTISNHFHPGSRTNSVIGAALGAAGGSAAYFGGPARQPDNERIFRLIAFVLGPSLGAYAGWHVGSEGIFYASASPTPAWSGHLVGDESPRFAQTTQSLSVRF